MRDPIGRSEPVRISGCGRPARPPCWCGRSPNSARPTRTIVAPSSMATSKSSVMPIDSSGPSGRAARSQPLAELAQRRERRPRRLRALDQPADRHQPADLERVERGEALQAPRAGRRAAKPGLGRVVVDVDLEQDRIAARRSRAAHLAGQAIEPLGEPDRVDRLDRPRRPRAPGGPCSTAAGRPAASARRAPRAPWPRPPGRGSRRTSVSPAATASRNRRGASTVLDTATSVTSSGARPTRAQAAAMRARTSARAAANPAMPGEVSVVISALPPAAAGAGHLRRRKLGISRSSAS